MNNNAIKYFAGEYTLSGYGINRGYFLIINFSKNADFEPIHLSRIVDKLDKFDEQSERALATLPLDFIKTFRDFPYDCHFVDYCFMTDFDTRNLKIQNFRRSFDKIIRCF